MTRLVKLGDGCVLLAAHLLLLLHSKCFCEETCYTQRGIQGVCKTFDECASVDSNSQLSHQTICSWSPLLICCTKLPTGIISGKNFKIQTSTEEPSTEPVLAVAAPVPVFDSACGNGLQPKSFNIVNGEEAKIAAWPWMTAIYSKPEKNETLEFLCGGSVISRRYILSAAHCFKSKSKNIGSTLELLEVRLGEHSLIDSDLGDRYEVEEIIIHENFRPPLQYNDIAIMRLKTDIKYSWKVAPVCLPDSLIQGNNVNLTGRAAVVAGWGHLQFAGSDSSVLREVEVPITSNYYCDSSYRRLGRSWTYPKGLMTSSMICAGYEQGGKDACQNDSGGPLMIFDGVWRIVGIVSGGFQCARPNLPGLYTRVTDYLDWINANVY